MSLYILSDTKSYQSDNYNYFSKSSWRHIKRFGKSCKGIHKATTIYKQILPTVAKEYSKKIDDTFYKFTATERIYKRNRLFL